MGDKMGLIAKKLANNMDELNNYVERKAMKKRDAYSKPSITSKIVRYISVKKSKISKKIELLIDSEKRKYQSDCNREFQVYLNRHNPKRIDTFNVDMLEDGSSVTTINHIISPIVRTVRPATRKPNIKMYSAIQEKMGLTDSDVTVEGYAYIPDEKGIKKYYYAKVRRTEYRGIRGQKDVLDFGLVNYQGFYRTEEGEFLPIKEQFSLEKGNKSAENKFYKAIKNSFDINAEMIIKSAQDDEMIFG